VRSDSLGELKKYKIGEIAEMAGVSRRTIDYYTNIGLLNPIRSESNYRYYSYDALVRLKIVESMKAQRYTLEEIKNKFERLFTGKPDPENSDHNSSINFNYIQEQLKSLESQISRLQPAIAGMDSSQAAVISKQVLFQSLTLMQTLIMYINEIAPML
jgi:DNA-binding transcriptional MerR regulator